MDVEICKKLLKQRKFDDLIISIENEFILLYKDIIKYNDIAIPENQSLASLGNVVMKINPAYEDIIIEVENAINSGEYNYGQIIDILLDSYNYLSKDYKLDKKE